MPSPTLIEPSAGVLSLGGVGTFAFAKRDDVGKWMSLQLIGNASANTVTWEVSNDSTDGANGTWIGFFLTRADSLAAPVVSTAITTAGVMYHGPVPGRMVRVRMSAFVATTTTIRLLFHNDFIPNISNVVDTEIATAAALADATANPTTGSVGADNLVFNGTTWDRQREATADAAAVTGLAAAAGVIYNGATWDRIREATADALAATGLQAVAQLVWNGASWDRQRAANIVKFASPSGAGNTALWTPTGGKKFRLMRFRLSIDSTAALAVAGPDVITLQDAAASMNLLFTPYVPAAAPNTPGELWTSGWIDLGNGILSSAANNVLNVNLSTALTAGTMRAIAIGTEE